VTKTYVDSGVLIAAARGNGKLSERALAVLRDTAQREFVSSDYVKLETVPKPTYFGRDAELKFYDAYFASVSMWFRFDATHLEAGLVEACNAGLQGLDAVHVILADISGCDELVTTEKPTSAIHRTARIRIVSIDI
jgi:predicted nucleic acid-binding protein